MKIKPFYRKLPLKYRRSIKFLYYSFFRFTEGFKSRPKLADIPDGPKISVIVPVFRHDQYLRKCIDSVIGQSYRNIEILLVNDDLENEAIRAILNEYVLDPRVRVFYNDRNLHVSETLNRGIKESTGEYLAFVDCDDMLFPYSLQEVVKYIQNNEKPFFISTQYIVIDRNGKTICYYGRPKNPSLLDNMWASHLKIVHRSIFDDIGLFDPRWSGIQDYELALRVEEKYKIHYLPQFLYKYREHPHTYTVEGLKMQYERSDELKRMARLRRSDQEKKKIFYLITQSSWGGAQRYVYDLATNIGDDFEVVVACGSGGILVDRLREKSVRVVTVDNLGRSISPLRDIICLWQLFRLLRIERPDILHTNSTKAIFLGNIAGKMAKISNIVSTVHGLAFHEPGSFLKKYFYKKMEKIALQRAGRIICVSMHDFTSGGKNRLFKGRDGLVIHNGVEVSDLEVLPEVKTSTGPLIVAVVANMYKNKGLAHLLESAKIVRDMGVDIRFKIAGDGPERKRLEAMVRKMSLDNIEFIGFALDIRKFLSECDIFVLTSLKEGLPYAVLEAMNARLPVVATNVGGIPEIVEDGVTGFLVKPGDVHSIAEKVVQLAKDHDLRIRFGRAGNLKIANDFNINSMVLGTRKVYKNCLRRVFLK